MKKSEDSSLEEIETEYFKLLAEEQQEVAKGKWAKGDLSWKLHSAQLKIYNTIRGLGPGVRESVILCARRFGKSYLGVLLAIEDCVRNPGSMVRIIGPEIKQTTQIVVPIITKIIADAPHGFVRRTKSENKWVIGSSELVLGGFDAQNIDTHRGSESYSIYIEESGSSDSDQYQYAMKDVLKPQLLHSRGRLIHLTTPPKVMTHEFVLETIPEAKVNQAFFKYTIYDNPLLDSDQISDAVRDSGGIHSITFKREYLCELIKDETVLIVPEFDEYRHVESFSTPEYAHYITVIDMGGVRDKTVALLCYYDFEKGKRRVLDERVFPSNTPTSIVAQGILEMESQVEEIKYRWADASGQTQVDMHALGFGIQVPPKEDWEANINQLKIAFQEDRWRLNEKCKFTIATLSSGTFNKNHTDFERSNALGHCDAIAAMMYANRVIDMSNPVPAAEYDREKTFHIAKPTEQERISAMLQPKMFGTFKKPKRW